MQLVATSSEIIFDPNPADGALNQGALTWTKGYLGEYGAKARFFIAQVTANNQIKISRITDTKGTTVSSIDNLTLTLNANFLKAGSFSYCTKCTTNRACNIFMQDIAGVPDIWCIVQFNHEISSKIRENKLFIPAAADTSGYVKTFSRYGKYLYYIVVNDDLSETLHHVRLDYYNNSEYIEDSQNTLSVEAGKTDILAGEDYVYIATYDGVSAQEIRVYFHGDFSTPVATWTSIFTADTYNNYPVQMLEIDSLDLIVRKKGTQLYRIIDGDSSLLSDTLDEDLSQFRLNSRGLIYVEGANFSQISGDYDEHKDKWYLLNDALTLETFLSGVVAELLIDCGIAESDFDVSEIIETSCRGFKIEGQTQYEVLQELMLLYDFSLPVIDGKIFAKKITSDTTATALSETKLGMGLNNAPQTVFTITEEIADTDYPKQITVRFTDADDNYKESAFVLRAQDSDSSDVKDIDLSNHSLSDSIAQSAAHSLFQKWYQEKGFWSFTASAYYIEEIQPGSLVTVTYENETHTLKVISVTVRDILIDVTCVKNYV